MIALIPVYMVLLFTLVAIQVFVSSKPSRKDDGKDEMAALKKRVSTLERIVTDRDRQLRGEIDGLG